MQWREMRAYTGKKNFIKRALHCICIVTTLSDFRSSDFSESQYYMASRGIVQLYVTGRVGVDSFQPDTAIVY